MNLYKFDPREDITVYELAIILRTFMLAMHGEDPGKNLELIKPLVDKMVALDPSTARHFTPVGNYD